MRYFKESSKDKLICLLCSHYCKLKKGDIGFCGVNQNSGQKVECLVYGYLSALNIDPIEKKPLYHFLPSSKSLSLGTVGCNFKCPFCQNWSISQNSDINKKNYYDYKELAFIAHQRGCKSISYTYNEPTIFYPFAKDIAIEAKKYGLKNIFVTNGYESSEVINDMVGVIDGANIDLKSFNKDYYKKELKGDLDIVLKNIKQFFDNNIHIEITTLIIPTKNDSDKELKDIANFIASIDKNIPWHISAFTPNYKEMDIERTSKEILLKAFNIGKEAGLNYIYIGNINYNNITNCPKCNEELITREYFNVTTNILKDNNCPKCGEFIFGVF